MLAQIFGCNLVYLSIKYLGVPLHWRNLNSEEGKFLIEKVEKEL